MMKKNGAEKEEGSQEVDNLMGCIGWRGEMSLRKSLYQHLEMRKKAIGKLGERFFR